MSTKHGHPRTHIHTMHKNTDTYKQTSSLQPPFRHLINEWKALAHPRYTCRNVAPNHMAPRNQLTHPLIASDKAGLGGTTKCDVIVKQRSWRSTGGWVGECGASLQCNLWHSHLFLHVLCPLFYSTHWWTPAHTSTCLGLFSISHPRPFPLSGTCIKTSLQCHFTYKASTMLLWAHFNEDKKSLMFNKPFGPPAVSLIRVEGCSFSFKAPVVSTVCVLGYVCVKRSATMCIRHMSLHMERT